MGEGSRENVGSILGSRAGWAVVERALGSSASLPMAKDLPCGS